MRLSHTARPIISTLLIFAALACLIVGIVLFPKIEWLATLLWSLCLLVTGFAIFLSWIRRDE
jgi:hypothetical protein